jgi:hypothetical protein
MRSKTSGGWLCGMQDARGNRMGRWMQYQKKKRNRQIEEKAVSSRKASSREQYRNRPQMSDSRELKQKEGVGRSKCTSSQGKSVVVAWLVPQLKSSPREPTGRCRVGACSLSLLSLNRSARPAYANRRQKRRCREIVGERDDWGRPGRRELKRWEERRKRGDLAGWGWERATESGRRHCWNWGVLGVWAADVTGGRNKWDWDQTGMVGMMGQGPKGKIVADGGACALKASSLHLAGTFRHFQAPHTASLASILSAMHRLGLVISLSMGKPPFSSLPLRPVHRD